MRSPPRSAQTKIVLHHVTMASHTDTELTVNVANGTCETAAVDEHEMCGAAADNASTSTSGHEPTTVNVLPDELLQHIFSLVDPRTLLLVIPTVCVRWRDTCLVMPRAHLDLRFKAAR
jgi:hypothetical protein